MEEKPLDRDEYIQSFLSLWTCLSLAWQRPLPLYIEKKRHLWPRNDNEWVGGLNGSNLYIL
jgi:hypothetical protein